MLFLHLPLPLGRHAASYHSYTHTHTHTNKQNQSLCHRQLASTSGWAFVIMSVHSCTTIWQTDQRTHTHTHIRATAWQDYHFIKWPPCFSRRVRQRAAKKREDPETDRPSPVFLLTVQKELESDCVLQVTCIESWGLYWKKDYLTAVQLTQDVC